MTKEEMKQKILEDQDFIKNPKFGNSLNKFLIKSDEELENHTIARFLMITEEEVERIYQKTVDFIRKNIEKE